MVAGRDGLTGTTPSKKVVTRARNMSSLIQSKMGSAATNVTPEDLVTLALGLALDQEQWDKGSDASRAKVKLDCLRFIHDVQEDKRTAAGDSGGVADFAVWVGRRRINNGGDDQ